MEYHPQQPKVQKAPATPYSEGGQPYMDGLIILNVSGDAFYLWKSSIMSKPKSLLSVILSKGGASSLVFDRDASIFRDVVRWYTTGILHDTTRLPLVLRVREYDFWGIDVVSEFDGWCSSFDLEKTAALYAKSICTNIVGCDRDDATVWCFLQFTTEPGVLDGASSWVHHALRFASAKKHQENVNVLQEYSAFSRSLCKSAQAMTAFRLACAREGMNIFEIKKFERAELFKIVWPFNSVVDESVTQYEEIIKKSKSTRDKFIATEFAIGVRVTLPTFS